MRSAVAARYPVYAGARSSSRRSRVPTPMANESSSASATVRRTRRPALTLLMITEKRSVPIRLPQPRVVRLIGLGEAGEPELSVRFV